MVKRVILLLVISVIVLLSGVSCRHQNDPSQSSALPPQIRYTLVFPPGQERNDTNRSLWQNQLIRRANMLNFNISVQQADENQITVQLPDACSTDIFKLGEFQISTSENEVILTVSDIEEVAVTQTPDGNDALLFTLTGKGTSSFAQASSEHLNATFHIYFDDELISSPRIVEVIDKGEFILCETGSVSDKQMAAALIMYPLPLQTDMIAHEEIKK